MNKKIKLFLNIIIFCFIVSTISIGLQCSTPYNVFITLIYGIFIGWLIAIKDLDTKNIKEILPTAITIALIFNVIIIILIKTSVL